MDFITELIGIRSCPKGQRSGREAGSLGIDWLSLTSSPNSPSPFEIWPTCPTELLTPVNYGSGCTGLWHIVLHCVQGSVDAEGCVITPCKCFHFTTSFNLCEVRHWNFPYLQTTPDLSKGSCIFFSSCTLVCLESSCGTYTLSSCCFSPGNPSMVLLHSTNSYWVYYSWDARLTLGGKESRVVE